MKHPFAPGDVVVCVDPRKNPWCTTISVERGRFYRVARVGPPCYNALVNERTWSLKLAEAEADPGSNGWHSAHRFRHISDENDSEIIARIKACKPKLPTLPVQGRVKA